MLFSLIFHFSTMQDNFKITNIKPGPVGDQQYITADYTYDLNTEAGFIIGRKGVASLTSVGGDIQCMITASTDKRYKTIEPLLRNICDTFRVYKLQSGVFSS